MNLRYLIVISQNLEMFVNFVFRVGLTVVIE